MALTGQAFGNVSPKRSLHLVKDQVLKTDIAFLGTHAEYSDFANVLSRESRVFSFDILRCRIRSSEYGDSCAGLFVGFGWDCGCQ